MFTKTLCLWVGNFLYWSSRTPEGRVWHHARHHREEFLLKWKLPRNCTDWKITKQKNRMLLAHGSALSGFTTGLLGVIEGCWMKQEVELLMFSIISFCFTPWSFSVIVTSQLDYLGAFFQKNARIMFRNILNNKLQVCNVSMLATNDLAT